MHLDLDALGGDVLGFGDELVLHIARFRSREERHIEFRDARDFLVDLIARERAALQGGGIRHPRGGPGRQIEELVAVGRIEIEVAHALRDDPRAAVARVDLRGLIFVRPQDELAAEQIQRKAVVIAVSRRIGQRPKVKPDRVALRLEAVGLVVVEIQPPQGLHDDARSLRLALGMYPVGGVEVKRRVVVEYDGIVRQSAKQRGAALPLVARVLAETKGRHDAIAEEVALQHHPAGSQDRLVPGARRIEPEIGGQLGLLGDEIWRGVGRARISPATPAIRIDAGREIARPLVGVEALVVAHVVPVISEGGIERGIIAGRARARGIPRMGRDEHVAPDRRARAVRLVFAVSEKLLHAGPAQEAFFLTQVDPVGELGAIRLALGGAARDALRVPEAEIGPLEKGIRTAVNHPLVGVDVQETGRPGAAGGAVERAVVAPRRLAKIARL